MTQPIRQTTTPVEWSVGHFDGRTRVEAYQVIETFETFDDAAAWRDHFRRLDWEDVTIWRNGSQYDLRYIER